ncbi:hypothetical protein BJ508DRAFT_419232 [Ascobolus immersus RN42]|uniref:Uncharacterized protein n=1 Tax=Ascobolus immersus RN42 TaxID=1160509 RepID=A0A3N4HFK3_ASCIM|nr:hypothetical protein BJ508DRAFT_419232 [Ascobolus immersus RN42]
MKIPDCCKCEESLMMEGEDEQGNDIEVLDDVELACHCHYHWDCVTEDDVSKSLRQTPPVCPNCSYSLPTLLVTVRNEGGQTDDFDLLQVLEEEAECEEDPHKAVGRACFSLITEGDADAVIKILYEHPEAINEKGDHGETLLHAALLATVGGGLEEAAGSRLVEELIRGGVSLNECDNEGRSVLALAHQLGVGALIEQFASGAGRA